MRDPEAERDSIGSRKCAGKTRMMNRNASGRRTKRGNARDVRIAVCAVVVIVSSLHPAVADDAGDYFETRIRPVLQQHCYECHSAEAAKSKKLKGALLLDTREGTRRGGETGPAVVPRDVGKSLLISALRHESFEMPPSGRLPEKVVADFVKWIEMGAPDPRDGTTATPHGSPIDFAAARRSHWAFQPPSKGAAPEVTEARATWPRGEIDRFVLARLEAEGMQPAAPADRRDLLRRVSFGLIGLPPTPEEMDAFLKDESPDPLPAVVDRLLDSPHYGERWGRHWLDVARYADDQALANARDNVHAFRYRDWVVQALQNDMPYDRFLRLQLAGDLLTEPVDDYFGRLAGLGFQGLGQLYHRGNFPEQVMADELDDRIDTVSRGLLGLTVACARCHDHKYDPIPTQDYYSLAAAYQGANWLDVPLAPPDAVARHARFVEETKQREAALAEWVKSRGRQLSEAPLRNLRPYLDEAWRVHVRKSQNQPVDEKAVAAEKGLTVHFLSRWVQLLQAGEVGKERVPLAGWHKVAREAATMADAKAATIDPPAPLATAADDLARLAVTLAEELARIEAAHQQALAAAKSDEERRKVVRPELSMAAKALQVALISDGKSPLAIAAGEVVGLLDDAGKREHQTRTADLEVFKKTAPPAPPLAHGVAGGGNAMRIHVRGNVERKGDLAPPGVLRVLTSGPAVDAAPAGAAPATPRFNRLDLAEAIASRDNPLTARVLVNRIWHHHFGRGIVSTPSNFGTLGERPSHPELLDFLAVSFMEHGWSLKWLHRQIVLSETYRLSSKADPANMARDVENRLLWRWSPRRLDFEAWRDTVLAVSGRLDRALGGPSQPVDGSVRRTIYSKISRSRLDPTLATFDFPDANVSSEKRSTTTVAQQQLFVLNSPFMIDSGKAFAARVNAVGQNDDERIAAAYRMAFGRAPTEGEREIGRRFLSTATTASGDMLTPWQRYAQALLASNEFAWVP
ncbi:MAG: PSD1 domain-containing protein [Planctomycetaceae bacterium]|nr:PSD1 domain-containing protein [Planctomycetaceae bacterium]